MYPRLWAVRPMRPYVWLVVAMLESVLCSVAVKLLLKSISIKKKKKNELSVQCQIFLVPSLIGSKFLRSRASVVVNQNGYKMPHNTYRTSINQ